MSLWLAEASKLDLPWSDQKSSLLDRYHALLRERAVPAGMIAAGDAARLRERHLLDCLRAATVVRPDDRLAIDIGSGAGLPGVVVAIARPGLSLILAEPRRARAAFLELVIDELQLPNARVHLGTAATVGTVADLCFARALGDASRSWEIAAPLLGPEGRLVYFEGSGAVAYPEGVRRVKRLALAPLGPLVIMTRQ